MSEKPFYKNNPIGSVGALAKALGYSKEQLYALAKRAPRLYRLAKDGIERKPDGSVKITYDPAPPLKRLQSTIVKRLLSAVEFPNYLHGGIRGRGYRNNCLLHTDAHVLIKLDIGTFFESIRAEDIRKVWQHFFHFHPTVAQLLADLTTHKGALPRGAPPSTLLANLLFWDLEPQLVERLGSDGLIYSRYVDDVTVSAKRRIEKPVLSGAIEQVYGMFHRRGMRPNRRKQKVQYYRQAIQVHNANVNGKVPTIPRARRNAIRAGVHNLIRDLQAQGMNEATMPRLASLRGEVAWLNQFHPELASDFQRQLKRALIKP